MFTIIADALMTASRQNGPHTKTRADAARRVRDERRKADTEFLRRYGDRHF